MTTWPTVPADVTAICMRLRAAGHEAYLVGGAMRDLLMGREPHDWDIATSAIPEAVKRIFSHTVDTGIEHGTVTVVLDPEKDGDAPRMYEVTTYRVEGPYSDGRRLDCVSFLDNIEPDLSRRDFTINAIAGDPLTGEIVDPFGGQDDIGARIIRAVGDPHERFAEDALRILRAFRFASVLEFDIDPSTIGSMIACCDDVKRVSVERIWGEISKMLVDSPCPGRGFDLMRALCMLDLFCPPLAACLGVEQMPEYHRYDVFTHTLCTVDAAPKDLVIRTAALLHDVGKPEAKAWNEEKQTFSFKGHPEISARIADVYLTSMRVSNEFRDAVLALVVNHDVFYDASWSPSAVRRFVKRVGPDTVAPLLVLRRADIVGRGMDKPTVERQLAEVDDLENRVKMVMAEKPPLDTSALAIDGNDIMEALKLGKGGPVVGKAKKELMELVLDRPELNEREILIEAIRAMVEKGVLP